MLRWTAGVILVDHIRNEKIRERFGTVPITDKLCEICLRWYGCVMRSKEDTISKSCTPCCSREFVKLLGLAWIQWSFLYHDLSAMSRHAKVNSELVRYWPNFICNSERSSGVLPECLEKHEK
ncbi:hypothetical protein Y032_0007g3423 [Ancylostoma ceylanicum]|uniref:Uncharacterized protein n=1 Tax=Ancylostoma ceylanicum TaxID=53326 RepID=A0A016VN79_9BILA|nr:hypothetical protein Y032_0007g3423 [Ancylostoma ceylanicum]